MKKNKPFLRIILFVIAVLFIVEIFLRITYRKELIFYSKVLCKPDSILGHRYVPNAIGTVHFPAFTRKYHINKWGFNTHDFDAKKQADIYRIIVLGSSDDGGLFTDGPLNYVTILEDSLRKQGRHVEVLNLAIDGSGSGLRNVKLATGECLKYQPDLVLFRNDFPLKAIVKEKYRLTYKGIEIKSANLDAFDSAKVYIDKNIVKKRLQHYLTDYSYLYRFVLRANYNYNIPPLRFILKPTTDSFIYRSKLFSWTDLMDKRIYPAAINYSATESIDILKSMKDKLALNKSELVIFDVYKNDSDANYEEIYNRNGIKYLSLNVPFKEEYNFGKLDGHASQKGHKATAKAFLTFFNTKWFKANQ